MVKAATATVIRRGQVTLPRAVRDDAIGDSRSIEFTVNGNVITLQPIPDMTGSLVKYTLRGQHFGFLSQNMLQFQMKFTLKHQA